MSFRDYLIYSLGTTGHAYDIKGYAEELERVRVLEGQLAEARLWAAENCGRARGLAQAIASATPYPPHVDGVRDIAQEIADLLKVPTPSLLSPGGGQPE